jgi:iron(III) transport system ATP-binding protein
VSEPVAGISTIPALRCDRLTVSYGDEPVLRDLDLAVAEGEALGILGPSGSGKTTLLHTIAGFVEPRAGAIEIAGVPVAEPGRGVPPDRRPVGLVFQHYALWPHMTALDTVAYPLRRRGVRDAREGALALLERMGLAGLAERRPSELSGGQQQRVGLARALARNATVYLFDEPTAHLDTALRAALQEEVTERRRERGAAAVYATHDAAEALAVADRVALLREGELVQIGTPTEVYHQPRDLWAAQLTGPATVVTLELRGGVGSSLTAVVGDREVEVATSDVTTARSGTVDVVIRPDWTHLGGELPGTVRRCWYRGPHTDYELETPAGTVIVRSPGSPRTQAGERVSWSLERGWALPRVR